MNIYEKYDKILTFDDKIFYKKNILSNCLSANKYIYFKNNSTREIDFYYEKNLPNRELKKLNNIYLFIFNRGKQSGGNFFHFHFHYLQKLIGYFFLNDSEIKLGIPLNMLEFQKNIILSLVPENKIVYLDIYQYNYEISECYIGTYLNIDSIPNYLFDKYQMLGYELLFKNNIIYPNFENNIFIGRRIKNNAGVDRCIINNDQFMFNLKIKRFKSFYFEDYNFEGKLINLVKLNPRIIVIENGSGLTNLLFIPKDILQNIYFIIIDQENWNIETSRIYDIILKFNLKHKILTCKSITENTSDIQNNPFEININEFNTLIQNYNNCAQSSINSS